MGRKTFPLFVLLAVTVGACRPAAYEWHGTLYDPSHLAPSIPLQADNGTSFDLSTEAGRAVILYFGYTNCPDVCPATLTNLAWVREQLGEHAADLTVLFVTVDPERDTLPVLTKYLSGFDPAFVGLRGDRLLTEEVLAAYGAYAGLDDAAASHQIDHSARVFLIGRDGRLVAHYLWDIPRADLLADIEHLLSS